MAELSLNIFVQPWESWTEIGGVCGIFVVFLKS